MSLPNERFNREAAYCIVDKCGQVYAGMKNIVEEVVILFLNKPILKEASEELERTLLSKKFMAKGSKSICAIQEANKKNEHARVYKKFMDKGCKSIDAIWEANKATGLDRSVRAAQRTLEKLKQLDALAITKPVVKDPVLISDSDRDLAFTKLISL